MQGGVPPTFPFCSMRCRMVDLGQWLEGNYKIPCGPPEEDEEAADPTVPAPVDDAAALDELTEFFVTHYNMHHAGMVAEPSEIFRRAARSRPSPSTFLLESGGP